MQNGCTTTYPDAETPHAIELEFEQVANSGVPKFTAVTRLQAPMSKVMSVLMDFSRWPEWVYGCKRSEVLQIIGYQEAYVYQVTGLPLVRDRDAIVHARLSSDDSGDKLTIVFESAPDYCVKNERDACQITNQENTIRMRELVGQFVLQRRSKDETILTWEQYTEPAGMIPDWATALMLPRVPGRSLTQLQNMLRDDAIAAK